MRFLSVADFHYTLKQWDWVASVAKNYDLLVIPGDLLDIVTPVDLDVQILVVKKYLRRIAQDTPILVSSGNHDGNQRSEYGESVAEWLQEITDDNIFVDGKSYEQDGVLFSICPWWDGDHSMAMVEEMLVRDSSREKDRWVWLYHAPPTGSPLAWDGRREFGDDELPGWIERFQPNLVLAGHIHQAPFVRDGQWYDRIGDSLVFNAGKQIGEIPALIEFDLSENIATWRSLAGVETLSLQTGEILSAC